MRAKNSNPDDKVEFDPNDLAKFLLENKNHKKIKEKKAKKVAKEAIRKARANKRHERKEEYEQLLKERVKKLNKMGIDVPPLLKNANQFKIQMIEVDSSNPTAETTPITVSINKNPQNE